MGLGRGVERDRGEQVTDRPCDRCGKPTNDDDERECESCCEAMCSRCMNTETLCNDCEASQEEEAAFPEEFEP